MINHPQHYLVVDDDSTSNLICNFTIRKFDKNARIDLFLDPVKALTYIEQKYLKSERPNPTVLFLDINMPNMSGFEFLEEYKNFDEYVQQQFSIYMLSSSIEDFKLQGEKYPAVAGFLSKPLSVEHLEKIWKQKI